MKWLFSFSKACKGVQGVQLTAPLEHRASRLSETKLLDYRAAGTSSSRHRALRGPSTRHRHIDYRQPFYRAHRVPGIGHFEDQAPGISITRIFDYQKPQLRDTLITKHRAPSIGPSIIGHREPLLPGTSSTGHREHRIP